MSIVIVITNDIAVAVAVAITVAVAVGIAVAITVAIAATTRTIRTDLSTVLPRRCLELEILHGLSRWIIDTVDLRVEIHHGILQQITGHAPSICAKWAGCGFCCQLASTGELRDAVRD